MPARRCKERAARLRAAGQRGDCARSRRPGRPHAQVLVEHGRASAIASITRRCASTATAQPGSARAGRVIAASDERHAAGASRHDGDSAGSSAGSRQGLSRSPQKLTDGHHRHRHQAPARRGRLDELEDLLIGADLGPGLARSVIADLPQRHASTRKSATKRSARARPRASPPRAPVEQPLAIDRAHKPFVDPGDRRQWQRQDHDHRQARQALSASRAKRSILAAGDTFRAAAVEQLKSGASAPARR